MKVLGVLLKDLNGVIGALSSPKQINTSPNNEDGGDYLNEITANLILFSHWPPQNYIRFQVRIYKIPPKANKFLMRCLRHFKHFNASKA